MYKVFTIMSAVIAMGTSTLASATENAPLRDPAHTVWVKKNDIRTISSLKAKAGCAPSDVLTFSKAPYPMALNINKSEIILTHQDARLSSNYASVRFEPVVVPDDSGEYAIFTLNELMFGVSNVSPAIPDGTSGKVTYPLQVTCQPTQKQTVLAKHTLGNNTVSIIPEDKLAECIDEVAILPSKHLLFTRSDGRQQMIRSQIVDDTYFISQLIDVDETSLFASANDFSHVLPDTRETLIATCTVNIEGV